MKKPLIIAICGFLLSALVSCSQEADSIYSADNDMTEVPAHFVKLKSILDELLSSQQSSEGESYILYDSTDDSFIIMSAEEHGIFKIAEEYFDEVSSPKKAPKGEGWIEGDRGKGKYDAIKTIKKLAKVIPAGQNFELRVEYQEDNSYIVWWRPVYD